MCGICGEFVRDGAPGDGRIIAEMIEKLKHRGPDETGSTNVDGAVLGHARLAVIDLVTGGQPLSNEDETLWITFNGEIFNYVELRRSLEQQGHRFKTSSDTEVIVHGYEQYGVNFFPRMNGQWAIALWDSKRSELLLCRDRFGICPLFYTRTRDRILFSSEIKALFCDPAVPRGFDFRGLAEVFTFWATVAPRTVFEGTSEVPPGSWICFGREQVSQETYWQQDFPAHSYDDGKSLETCAEELREVLLDAVKLRFTRSDVPVAAYLSGGIDSSVTSMLIRQFTRAPLKTFSLRFTESEFDEGGFQETMVRRLGADHQVLTVSPQQIGEIFPQVVWHTEKPLLRTAAAPMFLLSGAVKEAGYKVVVTGEGSDEMLGGYDIFRETLARVFLTRNLGSTRRPDIITHLYPWLERNPSMAPAYAKRFFSQSLSVADPLCSHRIRWQSASNLFRLLDEDVRHEMEKYDVTKEFFDAMPTDCKSWHPLSRAQWIENRTLLSGYLLSSQGDRMLMAHGVEGRFPFLDKRIAEWASQLPPRYKIMGLDEKHVLKYAFRDSIPREILQRSKQPYRAPDAGSFFSGPLEWIDDLLSPDAVRSSGLFNPHAAAQLVNKCRTRKGRRMSNFDNMAVTALISTLLLRKQFIDRSPAWLP